MDILGNRVKCVQNIVQNVKIIQLARIVKLVGQMILEGVWNAKSTYTEMVAPMSPIQMMWGGCLYLEIPYLQLF